MSVYYRRYQRVWLEVALDCESKTFRVRKDVQKGFSPSRTRGAVHDFGLEVSDSSALADEAS